MRRDQFWPSARARSDGGGHGSPKDGGIRRGLIGNWHGRGQKTRRPRGRQQTRRGRRQRSWQRKQHWSQTRDRMRGRRGRSHWEPVAPVGRSGAGRRQSKDRPNSRRPEIHGIISQRSKLRLKIGPESRCSLSRCSGMELHHPIMSKLWDIGGRIKRKERKEYRYI